MSRKMKCLVVFFNEEDEKTWNKQDMANKLGDWTFKTTNNTKFLEGSKVDVFDCVLFFAFRVYDMKNILEQEEMVNHYKMAPVAILPITQWVWGRANNDGDTKIFKGTKVLVKDSQKYDDTEDVN